MLGSAATVPPGLLARLQERALPLLRVGGHGREVVPGGQDRLGLPAGRACQGGLWKGPRLGILHRSPWLRPLEVNFCRRRKLTSLQDRLRVLLAPQSVLLLPWIGSCAHRKDTLLLGCHRLVGGAFVLGGITASLIGRQRATHASPVVEVWLCDLPRCLRLRGRKQAELQEQLLVTPLLSIFSGTGLEERRLPPLSSIWPEHDLLLGPWPVALRHEALLRFVVAPGAWLGLRRHHLDGLSLVMLPPRRLAEDALTVIRKVVGAERQRLHRPLAVG